MKLQNTIVILLIIYNITNCTQITLDENLKNQKKLGDPVVWNCTKKEAAYEFKQKHLLNPFAGIPTNPYKDKSPEHQKLINDTIHNKDIVCAIQYQDSNKINYSIKQFSSKQEAQQNNYIVTHQGNCNKCSTLQDLSIYLNRDLTQPIAKCTAMGFFSQDRLLNCLKKVGFSQPCAEIWYFNMQNTRAKCYLPCLKMIQEKQPFVDPEGNLNPCLQCDEDKSGPVFKYYAGRTRRNSGIISEIPRPGQQVYPMNQCYY